MGENSAPGDKRDQKRNNLKVPTVAVPPQIFACSQPQHVPVRVQKSEVGQGPDKDREVVSFWSLFSPGAESPPWGLVLLWPIGLFALAGDTQQGCA